MLVSLKVSILVISYHQEDFIAATLRSALEQGGNVEIVVADDHSTDGTCDVVEEIARTSAAPIQLVRGERNVGITANCNRGLASCRGDLIAMLGGDDLMLPGKIAAQRTWMAASARRVLCAHDAAHFDSETGATLYLDSERVRLEPELTGAGALCRGETFYSGSSIVLRREAMPARGFDERLPMVSDRKLYIDTVGRDGVHGVIPDVWTLYRHHERNVSHTRRRQMFDDLSETYRLVAAEQPWFARECERGLARTYYTYGCSDIAHGHLPEGRRTLMGAIRSPSALKAHPKALAWLAFSYLPNDCRSWMLSRRGES
jgi:glycosyltransferase involved in cell wall biosynthesis